MHNEALPFPFPSYQFTLMVTIDLLKPGDIFPQQIKHLQFVSYVIIFILILPKFHPEKKTLPTYICTHKTVVFQKFVIVMQSFIFRMKLI